MANVKDKLVTVEGAAALFNKAKDEYTALNTTTNTYVNNQVTAERARATQSETTLSGRIDTFTSLPEGATSSDAELADIRVPASGFTVSDGANAGTAVREQVTALNDKVNMTEDAINGIGYNMFEKRTLLTTITGSGKKSYSVSAEPGTVFFFEVTSTENKTFSIAYYNGDTDNHKVQDVYEDKLFKGSLSLYNAVADKAITRIQVYTNTNGSTMTVKIYKCVTVMDELVMPYANATDNTRMAYKVGSTEIELATMDDLKGVDIDELNLWKNGSFEGGTYTPLDAWRSGEDEETGEYQYIDMPTINNVKANAIGNYSLHINTTNAPQYGILRGGKVIVKNDENKDVFQKVYACYGMSKVYVAYKIKMPKYVSGRCGISVFGQAFTLREVTDGWVTKSAIMTNGDITSNYPFKVGAWSYNDLPANLEAYIDDVVIINLDKHPTLTKEILDFEYARQTDPNYKRFSANACLLEYRKLAIKEAFRLGLTNSEFLTPSGQVIENADGTLSTGHTTCKDLIKIMFAVSANRDVTRAMSAIKESNLRRYNPNEDNLYTISSGEKTQTFTNGGLDASSSIELSYAYFTCVEKGGAHKGIEDDSYAKTGVAIAKIEGKMVVIVVGDADEYKDETHTSKWYSVWSLKIIADYVAAKLRGETPSEPDIKASYGAAVLLPEYPMGFLHLGETRAESVDYLYSKNITGTFMPASINKIILALLTTDYLDMEDMVELSLEDINTQRVKYPGSGCILDSRDSMTIRDLLYLTMMVSSNQAASALGRLIGLRILKRKELV